MQFKRLLIMDISKHLNFNSIKKFSRCSEEEDYLHNVSYKREPTTGKRL